MGCKIGSLFGWLMGCLSALFACLTNWMVSRFTGWVINWVVSLWGLFKCLYLDSAS